ncbi:MAG TPA: alpha/beta hydrolase [Intrasporangium sp.]|nr:alpha/beta hydrolase [Intrasporangium sp.]
MNLTSGATVTSRDGTVIAYERTGQGPALILVDAAGHYREFTSFAGLIELLAPEFTVYHYDRRGRGASTDTQPYAVAREVDDVAALIDAAGGSAFVYAFSSGGLLALHAANARLPIDRMALLEPPLDQDEDRAGQRLFTSELASLIAAGQPAQAVEFYLTGIGVPGDIIEGMRGSAPWSAMERAAPTLVYDCRISEATSFDVLTSVVVPTLVLDSEGSSDDLTGMAATVAGALPNGSHRSLPGAWHGVPDHVLAPALIDFFR